MKTSTRESSYAGSVQVAAAVLWVAVLQSQGARSAELAPAPPSATRPAATQASAALKPEELEQLCAQIALYPDSVLAQTLMAATYPLEVVQAERWANENKQLKGDALSAALEKMTWDPSVKSLVTFPQVLTLMSKQLDWTIKLGDAFIADQKAVMDAVQRLRARAKAQGTLKDTPEQKVIVEKVETPAPQVVVVQSEAPPQVIKIESPSPQVVYVPTYNPTVVYGAWPYPAYPVPTPYYPPGYVASNMISFGAGVALGAAWGYAWGGCSWGHGEVDIDIDRNTEFNRNINRESYRQNIESRQTNRQTNRQTGAGGQGGRASSFQHDPSHRKGVSYRDQATANQFSRAGTADAAKARQDFRGRAETGRQDIARGGADQFRRDSAAGRTQYTGAAGGSNVGRGESARTAAGRTDAGRTGGSLGDRSSGGYSGSGRAASPSQTSSRSDAFSGVDRGGSATRNASDRGYSSRSSSSASPSRSSAGGSRSSGGGSRSGGGGSRGGGGRGGGGRR